MRAHQAGIVIMMVVSTILAFLLPISIIATGNCDVHGALCLCIPSGICCRNLCKGTIDKSRTLQHDPGAVVWFLWTAFFHAAEAKPLGLCQVIFGNHAASAPMDRH